MRNPSLSNTWKKDKEPGEREVWFTRYQSTLWVFSQAKVWTCHQDPPKKCIMHLKLQWNIYLLSMPESWICQDHFQNDSGENIGIGRGLNFTIPPFTTPPPSPIVVTVSNHNLHFPRPINTRHSWTGGRNPHQNGTRNSPASTKIFF